MKYCPYCGSLLVDSKVFFCSECGKELPKEQSVKEVMDRGKHDEVVESLESPQKSLEEQNMNSEKPLKRKKEKRKKEKNKKQEMLETNEEGYDGYYDDKLPEDQGERKDGLDGNLIKKALLLTGATLLIVSMCAVVMSVL